MFIEYNWTAACWQFRIGRTFTDFRGVRSWGSLEAAREFIEAAGCKLIRRSKTVYEIN